MTKPYGYWNDIEKCRDEAKKYNGRYEFQLNSYGAYNSALRHNWLNEICCNYDNSIKYMNYYNKINIVYGYFLHNLNTCYIGRTNNIKRRHRQHINGIYKHGDYEYDNLNKFCNKNNIIIPLYTILYDKLTAKESQIKEKEMIDYYQRNGWNVLNKAKTGENIGSLGARLKWTYSRCKEESKKYISKNDFKKNSQSAYNSAVKNKWINEFFKDIKKPNGYWNNITNCINEAKKYKNIKDIALHGKGLYNALRRNNWIKLINFK